MSQLHTLPRRPVFWLHLLIVAAATMVYMATRTSLGSELVMGGELSLLAIAGWATRMARWLLAASILLAVVGRAAAAMGTGGLAIGLIVSPVMQFLRDAMGMREFTPEIADKKMMELVEFEAGSGWLAAGIGLWVICLLALAVRPVWGRTPVAGAEGGGSDGC